MAARALCVPVFLLSLKKRVRIPTNSPSIDSGGTDRSRLEGKEKCTLVQALRVCTGRTARRWSRGIALPLS